MKKYEFTGETQIVNEKTLHRIRALRDFGYVNCGDIGGWIEKEENLSHDGNAWVYGSACVWGNAEVSDNALVYGNAYVFNDAQVYENAQVFNDADVYDSAEVYGNAEVSGNTRVYGNAMVYGSARVIDNAVVYGSARVGGNARILRTEDYIVIGPIGSRRAFTSFYRGNNSQILVSCGCFSGTLEAFAARVYYTHNGDEHGRAYLAAVEFVKQYFGIEEEQK